MYDNDSTGAIGYSSTVSAMRDDRPLDEIGNLIDNISERVLQLSHRVEIIVDRLTGPEPEAETSLNQAEERSGPLPIIELLHKAQWNLARLERQVSRLL